jgi:ankyrin repeat protein
LAARDGHLDIVDRLLEAGFDVNAEAFEQDGRTALQAAFEGAHWDIIDRLLAAKADINAEPAEKNGITVIQAAAAHGNLDLVHRLFSQGANVNIPPSKYNGPMAIRILWKDFAIIGNTDGPHFSWLHVMGVWMW